MNLPRGVVTILFSVAVSSVGCTRAPDRQHVTVSGPMHVASGAAVILKSPEALESTNNWNALCLQPSAPNALARTGSFGILTPHGEQFFPKVLLRNAAGIEDAFERSGQMGGIDGLWLCFEPQTHEQILHAPYVEASIVSPFELQLSAVKWHSSDK